MHDFFSRWTLAGLLALGLVGCPGKQALPIDSNRAALEITQNTDGLADGIAQATTFVGASEIVKSANTNCITQVGPDGQSSTTCTGSAVDTAKPAHAAADWLKQHLFNADHLNAQLTTPTAAVFCLAAGDFCTDDIKCAAALVAEPVCLKVQTYSEGEYEIAMLVGVDQALNPFNVSLKPTQASLEARLADLRSAYLAFSAAAGAQLPDGFPTRLEGRTSWEITKTSDRVLTFKAAVLDAIAMDLYPVGAANHVELRVAAAPDLWTVTLDGDQQQVSASYDAKAIDLVIAANRILGSSTTSVTGELLMHLDGVSYTGQLSIATAEESLAVKGIGLGDGTSKIQYRDNGSVSDLIKIDLNASLGRRVDVTYVKRADGVEVQVSPGLALLVDHDFRSLAAQLPSLKGWALKAVSSVSLTGNAPAVLFPTSGQFKVEAGTLQLDATGMVDGEADVHVTVLPNQCLSATASSTSELHPFAAYSASVCSQ